MHYYYKIAIYCKLLGSCWQVLGRTLTCLASAFRNPCTELCAEYPDDLASSQLGGLDHGNLSIFFYLIHHDRLTGKEHQWLA